MKFKKKDPPRTYEVGYDVKSYISDCGEIELEADEQVTFITPSGGEYDLTRKSWGFYATPSLNHRLAGFKLRGVLVKNRYNRYFVMLVEVGKEDDFMNYVEQEPLVIVSWLDSNEALDRIERALDAMSRS